MSEDQTEAVREPHEDLVQALQALRGAHDRHYVECLGAVSLPLKDGDGNQVPVESKTQVKLSLRVFDVQCWSQVLRLILKEEIRSEGAESGASWRLHVCRQYLLDEGTDKLKFTWIFQVTSQNLRDAVRDLCRLLDVISTTFVWTPPAQPQPQLQQVPVKLGPRPDHKIFDGGPELVDGEVVSMPLLGKVGRNIPEGGLFEAGKGQKGAHAIKVGR